MLIHRGLGWRFRILQIALLAAVFLGLNRGIGDGFAVRDRSVGITGAVADTWNGTFRAIRRQVDRLGLPG